MAKTCDLCGTQDKSVKPVKSFKGNLCPECKMCWDERLK